MTDDREATVIALITDVLGTDVTGMAATTELETLEGWDSLRRLNTMMALEETFDLVLDPDDIDRLTSVEQIGRLIDEREA